SSARERDAIAAVASAHEQVRPRSEALLRDWPRYSLAAKRQVLETELEQGSLLSYERAVEKLEALLGRQQRQLQSHLASLVWMSPAVLALPLAGAVALLLWSRMLMRRGVIDPLMSVQRATETISRGDLAHPVPEHGAAEVRRLARSINAMAADLAVSRASLVRAEKDATLAALIPVVAHNIRNPLASIRATAQVLDDESLPPDVREGLDGIVATTDRLEHWTHALLSYLNPLEPRRVRCPARVMADHLLDVPRAPLEAKQMQLDLSRYDPDVQLDVDATLVEQALHGLLLNAIEASPAGASLALALEQEN